MALGITFSGEACETRQDMLDRAKDYFVTIRTVDGMVFDAFLIGPDRDAEWQDTVIVRLASKDGGSPVGGEIRIRAENVHVY